MITDTSKNQKKYNILKVTFILFNVCVLLGFSGLLNDEIEPSIWEIISWELPIILYLLLSLFISTIIHELGHLVFGLIYGYKFLSFKVLIFKLTKRNNKIKFKFDFVPLLGQCLMTYDKNEDDLDIKGYLLGGARFNLIFSILSLVSTILFIVLTGDINEFVYTLFWLNTSLYLSNRIPLNIKGVYNDGLNFKLTEHLSNAKLVILKSIKLQDQIDNKCGCDEISNDILECINLDLPDVFTHIYEFWIIETTRRLKNNLDNPFEFVKKFHYRRNQYPLFYQYLNVQLVLASDLINGIDYRGLLYDKAYKDVFKKPSQNNPLLMCSFDVIEYLDGNINKDQLLIRLDENREYAEKYCNSTIERECVIALTKLMYKKTEDGGFDKKDTDVITEVKE